MRLSAGDLRHDRRSPYWRLPFVVRATCLATTRMASNWLKLRWSISQRITWACALHASRSMGPKRPEPFRLTL